MLCESLACHHTMALEVEPAWGPARGWPLCLHPESDEMCQKGQPAGRRVVQAGKDLRLMQGIPRAAGRAPKGKVAVTQPLRIPQGRDKAVYAREMAGSDHLRLQEYALRGPRLDQAVRKPPFRALGRQPCNLVGKTPCRSALGAPLIFCPFPSLPSPSPALETCPPPPQLPS